MIMTEGIGPGLEAISIRAGNTPEGEAITGEMAPHGTNASELNTESITIRAGGTPEGEAITAEMAPHISQPTR